MESESDYRITKGTGWLEILGCGMVNPKVFKSVSYDVKKWNGYAFGLGIERIAMLKYGIDDIRLLYEGDINSDNICSMIFLSMFSLIIP